MSIQVDWLRDGEATDDGLGSSAVRYARVWTASPMAALGATDLPVRGAPHPDNQFLGRTTMTATREIEIPACIVTVNYGIEVFGGDDDDSARNETPFDTANIIGRIAPDVTTEEVAVAYPVLTPKRQRAVSLNPIPIADPDDPPDPAGESQLAWQSADGAGLVVRTLYTVRASFRMTVLNTLSEALGAFSGVGDRSSQIHVIGGKPYLFRIRLINPATEGVESGSMAWNAEYTWMQDGGLPVPDYLPVGWQFYPSSGAVGNDDYRFPALASQFAPGVLFHVPPFSDVLHGPLELEDQSLTEPQFFARLTHKINLSGHLGLPGVPT